MSFKGSVPQQQPSAAQYGDGYLSVEEAKRRLEQVRAETRQPLPKLDSMVRAQKSIDVLRGLTKSMKQLVPGGGNRAAGGGGPANASTSLPPEPIIPYDTDAFLQILHRNAVPDEDLREKYDRVLQHRQVASLHLSSQATPPSGEYRHVLQAKVDPFQSNEGRVSRLISLSPRSLAKQKLGGAGFDVPGGEGDDDHEADDGQEKKSQSNLRMMADSLASTKTDELLEKSIVLQQSKQDFQGNLSLKKAVQLAMAAQHAQQMESMKRTFEQRLNEAVKAAREEGLIVGRKEGADSSRRMLDQQEAKIDELTGAIERLQSVAEQSFVEKETTVTKVHFVRDEKDKWKDLSRKYEDVNINDMMQQSLLYEQERQYLYAKAFRSTPDWDAFLFGGGGQGGGGSRKFTMHPSTAGSTSLDAYRSTKSSERNAARGSAVGGGRAGASRATTRAHAMQCFHEALCRQVLAMHDPLVLHGGGHR